MFPNRWAVYRLTATLRDGNILIFIYFSVCLSFRMKTGTTGGVKWGDGNKGLKAVFVFAEGARRGDGRSQPITGFFYHTYSCTNKPCRFTYIALAWTNIQRGYSVVKQQILLGIRVKSQYCEADQEMHRRTSVMQKETGRKNSITGGHLNCLHVAFYSVSLLVCLHFSFTFLIFASS